jgi:hypothetical protein
MEFGFHIGLSYFPGNLMHRKILVKPKKRQKFVRFSGGATGLMQKLKAV